MSRLSWVRGNPALMTVTLKQINADGTKTPINLSTYDEWDCKVWRLSSYKKVEGDVTAALDADGRVVLSIPATIPCGIYSVEIVCIKNGYDRRSYEVPVFSIVDSNGEAHVTYDEIPCQASADIDMDFKLLPIAEVIGKNAYEMWRELPGHEDKTLQDYLDEVVDLDGITEACVTATDAAEAAAVIGSHPDYIGEDNYVYHWTDGAYAKTDIYCKGDKGDPGGGGGGGVQSDWNQTDTTADDYIKNKPTIPDVSGKADKATTLAGYGITDAKIASGVITLGSDTITPLTSHQDISSKADKVSSPTNGDFAALDSNGNLTDSGHKHSDYQTALSTQTAYTSKGSATKVPQITTNTLGQVTGITEVTITQPDITGKADKVTSATNGNFAALDSNGNLTDSGHKHGDYLTSHQDLSNYVQKSNTAGLLKNDGTIDTSTYLTSQLYTSAYCYSGSNERYKKAYCSGFTGFRDAGYIQMIIAQGNGCNADFYISINESGSKRVYIDGVASSSTNYNLQSGSYIVYYDTYNYYFNTDGTIPKVIHTSSTSGLVKNDGTIDTSTYLTSAHEVPAGGNAGQVLAKNSATDYDLKWVNQTQYYPSAYCTTAAGTAAKVASCSLWVATANSYLHVLIGQANTSASALTLNVNSTGAKPVYINGSASSSSNYTLPAGTYLVFYDGTNFHFRTDGKLPGIGGYLESTPSIATSLPVGDLAVNTYYALSTALTGAVTVTLPTVSDTAHVSSIALSFETGSGFTSLTITPPTGVTVSCYDGYAIEASKEYEINLLWNGTKWIVSYAVIE